MIFYADSIAEDRYAMNDNNLAISKVSNGKVFMHFEIRFLMLFRLSDKVL